MIAYQHLSKQRSAKSNTMSGTLVGGGLILVATNELIDIGLSILGPLCVGAPVSNLTKTGDSCITNESIDRLLVTYEGLLDEAARPFVGDHNLKEPLIPPRYGEFQGYPPVFLATATRD